jgi:hypothetical protein
MSAALRWRDADRTAGVDRRRRRGGGVPHRVPDGARFVRHRAEVAQSHMIREFPAFAGRTPDQFRARLGELTRVMLSSSAQLIADG